jgi:hypothetical protein
VPVKIDCYLSEHCGSFHELNDHIAAALKELTLRAEVEFHTIYSVEEAAALAVPGSPTVRVDGRDIAETSASPGIT